MYDIKKHPSSFWKDEERSSLCSRGTTFIRQCNAASTSLGRSNPYMIASTHLPDYGGFRPVLLSSYSSIRMISSRGYSGSFSRTWHTGFPPLARSLDATGDRYSSQQSLCVMRLFNCDCGNISGQTKTPFILRFWEGRRAIILIEILLSWYHLHLLSPCGNNL